MNPPRPMPDDFPAHVNDRIVDQLKRYRVSHATLVRWRAELGLPKRQHKRRMLQLDKKTGKVIREWPSLAEAADAVYGSYHNIAFAARHPGRSAYGYCWRYKE